MLLASGLARFGFSTRARQRRPRTFAACLAALWCVMTLTASLADDVPAKTPQLAEIIRNVAASEELYRDIEMQIHSDYRHLIEPDPESARGLVKSDTRQSRLVYQGQWFYHSGDRGTAVYDGRIFARSARQGYDGERTRIVTDSKIANIHRGRYETSALTWPHALMLADSPVGRIRLSDYLSAERRGETNGSCVLEGEEDIDGLRCFRLRVNSWVDGQTEKDYRLMWLAPERNYFPVRSIGYALGYSSAIPLEESVASEFRELAPGIWFPFRLEVIVNDELAASEGKVVVSNRREYSVKKAVLDPQYDISLFRDIEIPDGAFVYHIEDGKIVKSYRQGAREMKE